MTLDPSEIVWRPTREVAERARLARLMRAHGIGSLGDLQRRAVEKPEGAADPLARVGWGQSLFVGCAQVLALIPGTSRSGVTISAGLFANLDRATAARFSFMLGIPVTAAAGAYKLLQLARDGFPGGEATPLAVAILAAFVSGYIAVWFLVSYLKRRSLMPFVIYRLVLAAVIFAVILRG